MKIGDFIEWNGGGFYDFEEIGQVKKEMLKMLKLLLFFLFNEILTNSSIKNVENLFRQKNLHFKMK